MAAIKALKNGNWSDTTVWSSGSLPSYGDTVYSNSFTVTIDQDVTIGSVNSLVNAGSFVAGQYYIITSVGTTGFTGIGASANTVGIVFVATGAGSGTGTATQIAHITSIGGTYGAFIATVGGGFTLSGNYNITAYCRAGTSSDCLVISAGNYNSTIIGNIYGNTSNKAGINNSSTGTINITGDIFASGGAILGIGAVSNLSSGTINIIGIVYGGSSGQIGVTNSSNGAISVVGTITAGSQSGNSSHGVANLSNGTINLTGTIIMSPSGSTMGILNNSTGTINVTGTIPAGLGGGVQAIPISNASTGTVNFTGNITATGNAVAINNGSSGIVIIIGNVTANGAAGVNNNSTGTLIIVGNITASNSANGVTSSSGSANNKFSGSFINATNGIAALFVTKYILNIAPALANIRYALDGVSTYVNMYTADNNLNQAIPADVRYGTSYANGALVGTMKVPSPSNVGLNVPIDNTVGSAILTTSDIRNALLL
jgi:hypothetical protein